MAEIKYTKTQLQSQFRGEGAFLANLLSKKKKAFTLAETLIALGIIGIVAVLTLPSLLTKINDTVTKNKIAVFERKLSKGTDLLNIEYGIGPYYNGANPSYVMVS